MSEYCEYLQELLERDDEGSIARAVDHAIGYEYNVYEDGRWELDGEEWPPGCVFRLVEKTIYDLYSFSSVALVQNVMRIMQALNHTGS
jgi:hypothetical protein